MSFPDVFPDELLSLLPDKDVEFKIELVPGTTPISRRPYRMPPNELAIYSRIWKKSCRDLEAPKNHVIKESAAWRPELVDSDVALESAFFR